MNLTKEDSNIVSESEKLIRKFQNKDGIKVNCFGSVALVMTCPDCAKIWKDNNRSKINDLDLITYNNNFKKIRKILIKIGYELDEDTSFVQNRQDYLYSSELIKSCRVEVFGNPIKHFHHPMKLIYNDLFHIGLNELFLTKIQWSPSSMGKKQKIDIVVILDEINSKGNSKELNDFLIVQSKRNWKLGYTILENIVRLKIFLKKVVLNDKSKQEIESLLIEMQNQLDKIEYTFFQKIAIWYYKKFTTKELWECGQEVEYINNNEKD
jgi:hypothetical protein